MEREGGEQRKEEKELEVRARGAKSSSLASSPEGLAVGSETAHRHPSAAL